MRKFWKRSVANGPKVTAAEAKQIMRWDDEDGSGGKVMITVDRKRYAVVGEPYSGLAIKQLSSTPEEYALHLERDGGEDLRVEDEDRIPLKDGQEFYSEPPFITAG